MRKTINFFLGMIVLMGCVIHSCNKDDENLNGTFIGTVTDMESGEALAEVRMIIFDANTNSPTGSSLLTDQNGEFSIELNPGSYFVKLYKLGYKSSPAPGFSPIPYEILESEETEANFKLAPGTITDGGIISGKTELNGEGKSGVLVVAENSADAISTVSDGDGNYYIYNVPPGDYTVKGWISGHSSTEESVTLSANEDLQEVDLLLSEEELATVSGIITFLAFENKEVDVSLVHPLTQETIPGLSTLTETGDYSFSNVPDGDYIGRASYRNDSVVIDPDWIVKFGEPEITVSGSDVSLDFSVTGAVSLVSPTNELVSTSPVDVSAESLTFSWVPYPSTSDYVIEVQDASGNVIWGGFNEDWTAWNVSVPSSETSAVFNFDGSATESLETGKVYRWRVYASRDDNQAATGFRLISMSEDQVGLIRISE